MKTFKLVILGMVLLAAFAAVAQTSSNVSVFAKGFNNPRGLKVRSGRQSLCCGGRRWGQSLNRRSLQASSHCRSVYRRLYCTHL